MDRLPGRRIVAGLVVLSAVGLVGGYGVAMRARPRATSISLSSPTPKPGGADAAVYVHVGGAVRTNGLYRLADGARVDDAVRAAGGATDEADLDALNLAARVKDGDKVLVPRRGEGGAAAAPDSGPVAGPGGQTLVNLNTAPSAELQTLPGIGPALAERIIAYRTEHGGFRRVEDLMEVSGIGEKRFEDLKDRVTV